MCVCVCVCVCVCSSFSMSCPRLIQSGQQPAILSQCHPRVVPLSGRLRLFSVFLTSMYSWSWSQKTGRSQQETTCGSVCLPGKGTDHDATCYKQSFHLLSTLSKLCHHSVTHCRRDQLRFRPMAVKTETCKCSTYCREDGNM